MRVFESLIGYMKDSSAETQSFKEHDLADIKTTQNVGKYTAFASVALMVASVVTPFFSILALPLFAFTALIGRDIYLLTANIEEAWNENIDFGVGHEIKTATTAESFFNSLTKNTALLSSVTTIWSVPVSILDLDTNDFLDIRDEIIGYNDPNNPVGAPRAVLQQVRNQVAIDPNFGLEDLLDGRNILDVNADDLVGNH